DICHHGLKPGLAAGAQPNNTNCFGSTEVTNSPYFTQICQDLSGAITGARNFYSFVSEATFEGSVDATLWSNQISAYVGSLESLQNTMIRMNIRPWDNILRE